MKQPDKPFGMVLWDDAHVDNSDLFESDIKHAPARMHTSGWIIRSDAVGISLAQEWSPGDGAYRTVTFIPRPMVVEEIKLNLSRKKNARLSTKIDIKEVPASSS